MSTNQLQYRADIDGLRAVAVATVVLYHGGLAFPGGFVGVDVFFVISGFLITGLIWKDLQAGSFKLTAFWERRARRILPALVVVTAATAVAGWAVLFPHDLESLARSIAAQGVFSANILFWQTTGYFGEVAEEQPLLHTWSLSVEEQFYLTIPLLLLALFRLRANRSRNSALLMLGGVFATSLLLSANWVVKHPSAAFFSLPSRAWELSLGAILALAPPVSLARPVRETVSLVGLALVLGGAVFLDKATPFPGWAALLPCGGTALLIWSNATERTVVGRALALRPFVFLGLISYSLYLWHWPLLAFRRYASLTPLTLPARLEMIGLGVPLAYLSWRWVETPFRQRRVCPTRRSILTAAAVALAILLSVGAAGVVAHGFPRRLPAAVDKYYQAITDRQFLNEVTATAVTQRRLVPLGDAGSGRPAFLVWGDSHAMAALPAFDAFARERRIAGVAATHSSTAPLCGFYDHSGPTGAEPRAFNEAVLDYIRETHVPNVVLAAFWRAHSDHSAVNPPPGSPYPPSSLLRRCLLDTIRKIRTAGAQPWVFLQVPLQQFPVPKGMARQAAFHEDLSPLLSRPDAYNGISGEDAAFLREIEAAGAKILDPRPSFLDKAGHHYAFARDDRPLYVDQQHLTARAARELLLPWLREVFAVSQPPGDRQL